ncbi:MAG: hypothetical protein IRZ33_05745 [Alicyclobacillaceae bacterium]|nr:hypothetical protein [Alicyclobacillaceae bacterium]
MTDDLLDRFIDLLCQMENALIANDVPSVKRLTDEQQTCLLELAHAARSQPEVKQAVRARATELHERLARIHHLLQQGIDLADAAVRAVYGVRASAPHPKALARLSYHA